jgi:hypothetical protein
LPKSQFLPVYMNMQEQLFTDNEHSFWYGIASEIWEESEQQGLALPQPEWSEFEAATYNAFYRWRKASFPKLGNRQVLLTLDEFEKIGEALRAGRLSSRLLDQLRRLIEGEERLGFLFSGVSTLEELAPNWSSYFISVVPMEILYLQRDEARELIEDPDPDFDLDYAEGVVDEILMLTRCHPFLLQLMGDGLVKEANRQKTRLVTKAMLEPMIPKALEQGRAYFDNLWNEFAGTQGIPEQQEAGRKSLMALAHGQPLAQDQGPAAQAALKRMMDYHIVECTAGGCRIEIPLVERWVRDYAIL